MVAKGIWVLFQDVEFIVQEECLHYLPGELQVINFFKVGRKFSSNIREKMAG